MDMILASSFGNEERVITDDFDMDIGQTNDFELSLDYASWMGDLQKGKRIYIPGTEYGGIIKDIETASNTGKILIKGFTWRGYLAKRIIMPPSGQDYKIVSGNLNTIIGSIVDIPYFQASTEDTGSISTFQFERYVKMSDGLMKMCQSVGYRLDLKYIQTQSGGYVEVGAVLANNYGDDVEYSQDSPIEFSTKDNDMGVNHLICLGKGELKNRLVKHLYADVNGNISQTQSITGIDEIVEVFENSGAEAETLIETGTNHFKDIISTKSFTVAVKNIDIELFLGDTVSGKDYITGYKVTKPITDKIIKREKGIISISYKIEGQQ